MPAYKYPNQEWLHREIRRMHQKGHSWREIAQHLGLSEAHVTRVAHRKLGLHTLRRRVKRIRTGFRVYSCRALDILHELMSDPHATRVSIARKHNAHPDVVSRIANWAFNHQLLHEPNQIKNGTPAQRALASKDRG